jgi:hypothetical protein
MMRASGLLEVTIGEHAPLAPWLCLHPNQMMECRRYIQLRHHYEAALRHWEHVTLSLGAESNSAPAPLAAEITQKALEERNATGDRMCLHKRTRSVCTPKLKAAITPPSTALPGAGKSSSISSSEMTISNPASGGLRDRWATPVVMG